MKTLAELAAIRAGMKDTVATRADHAGDTRIIVGMATCGIAAGARPVMNALVEEINKRQIKNVVVTQTGCIGMCRLEPIVEVLEPGEEKVTYVKMTPEMARKVVVDHIINKNVVTEYTIGASEK
ncbi:MAG TPA: (2Fe-2S) ferredoxin domain-containing protein [Candidatus Acidoferrum sp.]|nr:(2Fe-2S) ferredoxin domain-containing protein [Candidatus Acidoferrum sp.]